jgi:hypothetical protein
MGDINKLALIESDQESSIITDKSLQDHHFLTSSTSNIINLTYDKDSASSSNTSSDSINFKLLLNVNYATTSTVTTCEAGLQNLVLASSPCLSHRSNNASLSIELEEINQKLQQSIDKFLENAGLTDLKAKVNSTNTCAKSLSIINKNTNNNELTLKTKSANDALTFLSLNEKIKTCLKYFEENLVLE